MMSRHRSSSLRHEKLRGTNVRINDTSGIDEETFHKSRQFRREVEDLLKEPRSAVLVFAESKCRQFNNCLEPWELISQAYLIGQERILNEKYTISSTEAWMKSTMWHTLQDQSRRKSRDYKRSKSLETTSSGYDDGLSLTLEEQVPSPIDPEHPYEKDDGESRQKSHRHMRTIYRNLEEQDRQLIKLRVMGVIKSGRQELRG
jgi:hypothetical protein